MRFNLRHSFPVLTTKRVFWRGELPALFYRGGARLLFYDRGGVTPLLRLPMPTE